jgi:Putative Zn-dependent protease, contains TPR repeats
VTRYVAVLLVAGSIACDSTNQATTTPRPSLPPVAMPDIANAAPDVQTRLRERYASLTRTINDARTSASAVAEAYGEMGKLFLAAEYFEPAERCFLNAASLAPSEMRWPYYLAHLYRRSNRTDQAAESFARALTLQPTHVPSLVWLAEMRLASNQPEEAERLLETARRLEPQSGAVLYGLGRAALARQDYANAVTHLESALTLAPTATRIHYPLALAYRGMGNRSQAEAHLRKRGDVDLSPSDPLMGEIANLLQNAAAYETRAGQALDARDWPEAIEQLKKTIELAPNNAYTRLNLGTAYYMQHDPERALEQYREAVRLQPSLARAHFGIGVLMEERGDDAAAIAEFTTAVSNDPGYLEARFSLANALRRSGSVEASLLHYAEALRINPAVSQASFGYAMGLVRLGRYQEARDRLEHDVKAFPEQPGFAHALARLLAAAPDDRVRNGARAQAILADLLKSQRTAALAETMAMAQAELGNFKDAIGWQRAAIDLTRQSGRQEGMAHLAETLALYQAGRPCRTPWTNDDPVHHPQPSS